MSHESHDEYVATSVNLVGWPWSWAVLASELAVNYVRVFIVVRFHANYAANIEKTLHLIPFSIIFWPI